MRQLEERVIQMQQFLNLEQVLTTKSVTNQLLAAAHVPQVAGGLPESISKESKWIKNTNNSKTDVGSDWPSKKLLYLLQGAAQGCLGFADVRPRRPPFFFMCIYRLWNGLVYEANQKQIKHREKSNGTDWSLIGDLSSLSMLQVSIKIVASMQILATARFQVQGSVKISTRNRFHTLPSTSYKHKTYDKGTGVALRRCTSLCPSVETIGKKSGAPWKGTKQNALLAPNEDTNSSLPTRLHGVTRWFPETQKNKQFFGSDVIPFVAMPHHQLVAINLHDNFLVPHCLPKGLLRFGHAFWLESFGQCLLVFCLHSAFKSCQCWTLKKKGSTLSIPQGKLVYIDLALLCYPSWKLKVISRTSRITNQCSHRKMQQWYSKLKNAYRQLVY